MGSKEDPAGQDWPNLAAMMFGCARAWPSRPMLRHHRAGAWHGMTWAEFARRAASVARRLRAGGVSAGDRVLICSESRPEVPILEVALMAMRAVPVPAYATNTPADHAHLLRDSGAAVAVVSTPALEARVRAGTALAGQACRMIGMAPGHPDPFAALEGDASPPDDVAAEAALIPPGALACLIYTSGTGGPPRGVMLPHRAILSNIKGARELVRPLRLRNEVHLSCLPLSHSFEHTVGMFFLPSTGAEVVYCRGIEHFAADMMQVQPTITTVVPRILEVMQSRILHAVRREEPWRQRLFERALAVGGRRAEGRMTLADRMLDPLLERLVRRRVRARFGGRFRAAPFGGARLDPAVLRFFQALGLTILQGYGQTEAGPVISASNRPEDQPGSVGRPLAGVELRLAGDGEILVRGGLVMDGYWGQPGATAEALQEGWLHTGDVGAFNPDGTLSITDRKKDIIVLSSGENVSPARIEGLLMAEPGIAQAVVAGDGEPALSALLVPAEGGDAATVADALARVNKRLALFERIRRHVLVPPFTVENGLLTPSHKIRRRAALQLHAAALREAARGGAG